MVKKATKEAKKEQPTKKPNTFKRYANFAFVENDKAVNTELSTLGFDKEPGKLVSYLCMGVALAGQTYKVPAKEMNKQINDFYNKFIEVNGDNKEENNNE